ncbi:uncharacterized protein LOC128496777 [Spea bombifrons]|uniref:uncharacterized protein LOC128496777 n=1 Tax=Spea bombifrons TaxID=233779 RepID=UPI00234A3502|nr:uncharacterized protein LOC128496777 [Spea bombifrons]
MTMEEPAGRGTIGELFLALYEMGFEESQVQGALRAGCLGVQDAADWILRSGQQRGSLHIQREADPGAGAVTAFNPPRDRGTAGDAPAARASPEPGACPPAISSRAQHRRAYEEKQSAREAEEAKEERRCKKKDRDLVLQRIAEDRQKLHDRQQVNEPQRGQSSESKGHLTDNGCALMVRLPSGSSIRLRFPADCLLRSVCDHLESTQPALAPCSLLQTFPTRHFTEEDMEHSLRDLGLTPNAALCVRHKEKLLAEPDLEPPASSPEPPASSPAPVDTICSPDELMSQGQRLLPILGSPAHSVSPNVLMRDGPLPSPQHSWGRGQSLVSQEQVRPEGEPGAPGDVDLIPSGSRSPGSGSHRWPSNGVRLRPSDESGDSVAPASSPSLEGPPSVRARVAAELRQESVEREPAVCRVSRLSAVPSLRCQALQGALAVITAPTLQYSGSLSRLTPELAELLIHHMIKERVLRPRNLELFTGNPVRSITLNCYQYCTNDLIRHLRGFPNLRILSLSACTLLTDVALSVAQYLPKLQYLNLSSCTKLTESCLLYLRDLKHLSHLVLDQTKVSDAGMCDFLLCTRSSLTHLSVNQTAVTERTLSLLGHRTPDLRVLSIKHTPVSDISHLCELKQLNTLHLDSTHVTEQSLMAVTSLSELTTLTLSGVQSVTSDRVLALLSGLSLTRLVLPGRRCLTHHGLSFLQQLSTLVELDLTDHTHITDQGVQHVSHLRRLQVLSLCNTSVSDAGLVHLQGLRHLEELSLDRTKVTSRGVSRCIPHLPHLQVLGLADTAVGDNVLKLGIRRCKNLLKVNLSRTRVTNKGLCFLREVSIVQMNLDGTGVTGQGVADLMLSCTSILSIRANSLRLIPAQEISDEED